MLRAGDVVVCSGGAVYGGVRVWCAGVWCCLWCADVWYICLEANKMKVKFNLY